VSVAAESAKRNIFGAEEGVGNKEEEQLWSLLVGVVM
jgi:hypothetical protein